MLKRVACWTLALILSIGGCAAMGENVWFSNADQAEWYQDMLKDGMMN